MTPHTFFQSHLWMPLQLRHPRCLCSQCCRLQRHKSEPTNFAVDDRFDLFCYANVCVWTGVGGQRDLQWVSVSSRSDGSTDRDNCSLVHSFHQLGPRCTLKSGTPTCSCQRGGPRGRDRYVAGFRPADSSEYPRTSVVC